MISYEIVDVFTDRAFTGNPLAVVFGAEDLTGPQMQAIARQFNLSETAFVLPPTEPSATYRVRIFTPATELPFAGHPSVGTAVSLVRMGRIVPGEAVQECGAGLLPVLVDAERATLTGGAATVGGPLAAEPLLAAAGLADSDLAGRPRTAGAGLSFPYLPVTASAVDRAAARHMAGVSEVYLFAWDADRRVSRSRLFAGGLGVHEDPATGSAALGLGVYLVAEGLLPADGTSRYTVHQGEQIGRPSVLSCTVDAAGGAAHRVTVTGSVVPVARGEFVALP